MFRRLWLNRRTRSTHADNEGWVRGHRLYVHQQTEARAGQRDTTGARWQETRGTGRLAVVCNCGYSTGWIARENMPNLDQLRSEHGAPYETI
ncbi:hypothetical protein ACFU0X_24430 [Streptomyces cellulosae]|uniref:Uncharacterized protein n=1 Tax=Streptomyces cellulosae TaxID=1968 RepID=A0ABW6JL71_STRCE